MVVSQIKTMFSEHFETCLRGISRSCFIADVVPEGQIFQFRAKMHPKTVFSRTKYESDYVVVPGRLDRFPALVFTTDFM